MHLARVLQVDQRLLEGDETEEPKLLAARHLHLDALVALAAAVRAALDVRHLRQGKHDLGGGGRRGRGRLGL